MDLSNINIGFAVTGSFCTIKKSLQKITELHELGANLTPILSNNICTLDTRFIEASDTIEKFTQITGKKPITTIQEAETIGPSNSLDIMLVCPATGNTIAKIANGISDTSVTMAVKAHLRNLKPVLICVSSNDALSNNALNIGKLLDKKNIFFVPFGQDDPTKKPNSLVSDLDYLVNSISCSLDNKQIQPLLISYN